MDGGMTTERVKSVSGVHFRAPMRKLERVYWRLISRLSQTSPDGCAGISPGIFVSGDVHDYRYKQAITAAGFGCQAGMDALNYLQEH